MKEYAESLLWTMTAAWNMEQLQAFFLVIDDNIDPPIIIGLDATNNALLLQVCIYHLLKSYLNLLVFFLQSSYQTETG